MLSLYVSVLIWLSYMDKWHGIYFENIAADWKLLHLQSESKVHFQLIIHSNTTPTNWESHCVMKCGAYKSGNVYAMIQFFCLRITCIMLWLRICRSKIRSKCSRIVLPRFRAQRLNCPRLRPVHFRLWHKLLSCHLHICYEYMCYPRTCFPHI